ncbi:hypothetical protein [Streptomyces sp. NPDC051554]|uniref:hypothetical protein n=1 Tax=Streptomyces sp. NPDC051554 TaxID=3365656 RepID=UPI0037A63F3E
MNWKQELEDRIAAMLQAGATCDAVAQELNVGYIRIRRVRTERHIPVPPERAKRTRAELDVLEDQAVAILRDGASYDEVRSKFRLSPNRIAQLRKRHRIPVPSYDKQAGQRRTVDEAFALYAQDTAGEHVLWTGPRSGRSADLLAAGRRHNARHVAFRKHHGRDPQGRVWRTCDEPGCIAGAHHTDHLIRNTRRQGARARTGGATL